MATKSTVSLDKLVVPDRVRLPNAPQGPRISTRGPNKDTELVTMLNIYTRELKDAIDKHTAAIKELQEIVNKL